MFLMQDLKLLREEIARAAKASAQAEQAAAAASAQAMHSAAIMAAGGRAANGNGNGYGYGKGGAAAVAAAAAAAVPSTAFTVANHLIGLTIGAKGARLRAAEAEHQVRFTGRGRPRHPASQ